MQFVDLDGVTIRFRVAGDPHGPWIVFANSLGTDLTVWDEVVDRLPAGFAVLGYDKRGHGLSSLPGHPLSIDDHAGDLLGLLDHLGVANCVLCGVSVGGMIGQRVAARAPERVRGLVLCNTGARIGDLETWNQRIADVDAHGLEPQADAVLGRWFTPAFREAGGARLEGCRAMLVRTPAKGYTATCAAIRDADLSVETARLDVPTLCIAGAGDMATPPELVRALRDLIPGAAYCEIPDCGHLPSVERPEECTAVIVGFLARLDAAAAADPAESRAYARGTAVRRRVLGDAHVDRATAQATEIDRSFQRFITEGAWGSVWSGRRFTLRERSLVTIAVLAAGGQDDELALHIRAAANTGAAPEDIAEALMHVAVYAGVPKANHAFKIAKQVFLEAKGEG